MDFSKIKKISFILLILFILFFPFWCVRGLCAEEVPTTTVSNLDMAPNRNYFATSSSHSIKYIEIEKGYIYHFTNSAGYSVGISFSNEVPANNVAYYDFQWLGAGETYDFIANDFNYFYFNGMDTSFIITRDKIEGQESAISDLVDNVGIGQIWNIFDISINYIIVVVLFAFGAYIIFRIIRKISKGKEGL